MTLFAVVYLGLGVFAVCWAIVRAAMTGAHSELPWFLVVSILVGLVVTWPLVLTCELIAYWRDS